LTDPLEISHFDGFHREREGHNAAVPDPDRQDRIYQQLWQEVFGICDRNRGRFIATTTVPFEQLAAFMTELPSTKD
jgi:hypothetical protein